MEEQDSQDTIVTTDDVQVPHRYRSNKTVSVSQSLQIQEEGLTDETSSLPEAVASLHAAIKKIRIDKRDMKILL